MCLGFFLPLFSMKHLTILILVFLLISSCRKNDDVSPTISVSSPDNMSTVAYGDIITVSGSASDDQSLKSIKIELLYDNLVSTDFSFEITVNNKTYDFTKSFELDDRHMGSGTYLLKVSAIDRAGNRKSEFIELNYGELPKELQGIALINKPSSSIYDLYYYDFSTTSYIQSFTGDFQSLLADSYNLLIWMSGGSAGDLVTYDLENNVINWLKAPQVSFYPYYNELYQMPSDHNIAVVKGNNTAVTMDKDGIVNRTYSLNSSAQGGEIFEHRNYILIEEIVNNDHYLSTYIKSTGSKVSQLLFNEDIIAIDKRDSDEIFIITSENNNCHLYLCDYLTGSVYDPHSIDPGTLYDFCVIDSDEVILAHSNGLMRFTVSNNSMVTIASDVAAQLEYESLSGTIYANVNGNIVLFDHLGNNGGSIPAGINVTSFALYYNK